MLIIDAHPHIYSADEKRYPVIEKPMRPPPGTGTVDRLRQEMKSAGVSRAVVVQVSSFYRWDNRLICDTVKAGRDWCTGVVTLDPDNPHSPDLLYGLVQKYGVRGLRSIPTADGSLDHPGVRALWQEARNLRITVNALLGDKVELAPQLAKLLHDFSGLSVVLDHCLNLGVQRQEEKLKAVLDLAKNRNLHAKVSFVPFGSGQEYPFRDMWDMTKRVIHTYGPDRCVWGSDFPLPLWAPKCSYSQHVQLFTREMGLSSSEQEAVMGKTAMKLWFRETADMGGGGEADVG